MAINLGTVVCKITPTLPSAYDYASTLTKPASIVPTEQGFVIVENATSNVRARRTTQAEIKRIRANAKSIYCIENEKTYLSLREAAEDTGASYQNISAVLHNRLKSTKGLHFKYSSELDELATNGEE